MLLTFHPAKPLALLAAALTTTPAFAELDWQAKASLSHSQQSYEEQPAQQQTQLLLSSFWQDEQWDLALSLPVMAMDANYQVEPGRTPNLCARIQAAKAQKLARWLRIGRVSQKTVDRCLAQQAAAEDETVSGLGDARLEANRYWALGESMELNLGAGLKAANADEAKNLGTGRESVYLISGLTYVWPNLSAGLNGEYGQYLGQGQSDERDTTQSLEARADWQWQPSVSLGFFGRWESSPYSDEDALTSAGLSLSYQPIKNLHLGLSLEHYQPNSQGLTRSLSGYIAYSAF
ncbi:MAG TPA: hypothetical protein PK129_10180 [Cellvibrionaceae bacterium]|nr:hypothetical protein [Cellvibrionaceae bacterium]